MSQISKSGNNIVVQSDINARPAVFSNWQNAKVTYKGDAIGDPVILYLGEQHGYCFSSNPVDYDGVLTDVNGIDVTAMTSAEIAALIANSILTEDRFSGSDTIITDTAQHLGQFTAIQFDTDTVLNVTAGTGTIMVDGAGTPIDISGWSGVTFSQPDVKYGNFAAIKLVSGKVTAKSNLSAQ